MSLQSSVFTISVFIVQDASEKENYELKFQESCSESYKKFIKSICESIHGITYHEVTILQFQQNSW